MDTAKNKNDQDKQSLITALEEAVEALDNNTERIGALEKSWHESEWYLGEARARCQHLEDQLRDKENYIHQLEAELRSLRAVGS